ncbi:MAG: tetratricopeptide repeat protein [Planctomycetota bacterium]
MRWLTGFLLASAALAQDMWLAEAEGKMEAGDYGGAAEAYGKAIEGAPGDARGYAGRARALQRLRRHADAVKDASKAIELAPKPDARSHAVRAFSYCMLLEYDKAIADCDRSIEIAPSSFACRVRGDASHGKREEKDALSDYTRALFLDATDATALHRRGEVKQALRDFAGAIEDFTQLVALVPDSAVPSTMRGRARMYVRDYEGALRDFAEALGKEGEQPRGAIHAARARALWALGRKEEADEEAARADEAPSPAETLAEVGRYYLDTGRAKEATASFQRAVTADPAGQDYTRLYLFLARARLGERPLAAGELKAYTDRRAGRDDWYSRVAGFLCGAVKEEDLFAAAASKNPQLALEQECEACWYAGAVRLLDRDNVGALLLFERCYVTEVRTFIEWESARMALAAMNK